MVRDYFNIGAGLEMFEDNELVEIRADVLRAVLTKLETMRQALAAADEWRSLSGPGGWDTKRMLAARDAMKKYDRARAAQQEQEDE